MAFKSVNNYNKEKFNGVFRLQNDGDNADVIFLYRDIEDVLVADVHYIKSDDYSGYVHCCGRGCPACAKNIRIQTKLFVPLYNVSTKEIEFFDRTMRFEPQLNQDVFARYPNPSEFVFRITRHGAAGDVNTNYEITVLGKNIVKSYDQILADNKTSFPEHYEHICRDMDAIALRDLLNSSGNNSNNADIPAYQPTPRVSVPQVNDTTSEQLPWSSHTEKCDDDSGIDIEALSDDENVVF